ncbi:MAG: RAD55 family ATPase [Nitrososphaerales archaeon]
MALHKENLIQSLVKGEAPKGFSFILSGSPGVGKTIFASNVFGEQLRRGVKCLYVALERPIESFLDQLQTLGYSVDKSQIVFVDAYSWRIGGGSGAKYYLRNLSNLNELSVKILMALNDVGREGFYLIDSLSNLATYNTEKEILHFFGVNSARLKSNLSTGIWIVEEGTHAPSFYNMLNHLADGVLEMKLVDSGNDLYRRIRAHTLRGMSNSMRWLDIDISSIGRITLRGANDEEEKR